MHWDEARSLEPGGCQWCWAALQGPILGVAKPKGVPSHSPWGKESLQARVKGRRGSGGSRGLGSRMELLNPKGWILIEAFLFPPPGTCLECEVCTGLTKFCKGPMERCGPGMDTCAVGTIETIMGQ